MLTICRRPLATRTQSALDLAIFFTLRSTHHLAATHWILPQDLNEVGAAPPARPSINQLDLAQSAQGQSSSPSPNHSPDPHRAQPDSANPRPRGPILPFTTQQETPDQNAASTQKRNPKTQTGVCRRQVRAPPSERASHVHADVPRLRLLPVPAAVPLRGVRPRAGRRAVPRRSRRLCARRPRLLPPPPLAAAPVRRLARAADAAARAVAVVVVVVVVVGFLHVHWWWWGWPWQRLGLWWRRQRKRQQWWWWWCIRQWQRPGCSCGRGCGHWRCCSCVWSGRRRQPAASHPNTCLLPPRELLRRAFDHTHTPMTDIVLQGWEKR
jgi:hypothetical protein